MYLEIVTDKQDRARQALVSWMATFFTCGYLLPWAIATTRGKSNAPLIGAVNLFTGWTVVGWFVALGMAVGEHRVAGLRVWTEPGR
ncbi:superinfection immunity protein [Nocardioides antri]|uniref:Superinfection immunity protein n=1 Tax=Nocardioides antri TaxID=2607659 RepID=A0A5B1M1M0_9ACTN|nr:superinfection immunity protein [Nocardioides antri]KAA1426664.1 superinfection immunity protein [Nocardioides antri]